MTQSIRFGLIGIGGIGAYHRASIEAQEAAGTAQLVAVADPWADRLVEQKQQLESRGVRWHLDYREMLAKEQELDAVVIATPIQFHHDMTMACIQRGLIVLLEKPPAPLIGQLESLIEADTAQAVSVGFQFIGSRCVQELKKLIVEGQLGTIREIRAAACWPRLDKYYTRASWAGRMTLGGAPIFDGPATNALAHLIHNIMFFAASERDEFAVPGEVQGELYRARPIESYDTACLRGRFTSGIDFSAAFTHATEAFVPFRIEARGSKGWARISNDGAKLESSVGVVCDCPQNTQELLNIQYAHFIDVIQGRRARYATRLADTRGYVSATNAMLLSSGGIHDVEPASIRRYEKDGSTGFEVAKLQEAIDENLASGRLFTEQGLPWAATWPATIHLPLAPDAPLRRFFPT
jgi:predicted dehydrogenase